MNRSLLLALVLAGPAIAQDSLGVGSAAPPITITRYVSAPASAVEDLSGRWAVVEFWAAWCTYCVGSVPLTDSLAAALAPDGIPVVTLSADPEPVLASFFASNPTRAWVAYDSSGATAERYQIGGYPQTVVIDPEGRIAAFTNPKGITAEHVRAIVRGEAPEIPFQYFRLSGSPADFEWDETTTADEDDADLYAQSVIRRSSSAQTFLRWRPTPGRVLGDGVPLSSLVEHAYGVSGFGIDNRLPNADALFRVSVVSPSRTHEGARRLLRETLASAFNLDARREARPLDVVVLRRRSGAEFSDRFAPASPSRGPLLEVGGPTGIHVTEVELGFLVDVLERYAFGRMVLDETGLDGLYDVDIPWTPGDPDATVAALEAAGFDVVMERRTVPVLLISARGE
ncbi:TIGR03435 family protein [Rubrivirga sp.]|uniref:TIGR03435 family protein n=1 Tax=Rubrivirga sp. TaxID=1885344 RepID=UPI003C7171FE